MDIFEKILKENLLESEYLDYKKEFTFLKDKVDFLKDIVAFSNNNYEGEQYIIYGIKEINGELDLYGLKEKIKSKMQTYSNWFMKILSQ